MNAKAPNSITQSDKRPLKKMFLYGKKFVSLHLVLTHILLTTVLHYNW